MVHTISIVACQTNIHQQQYKIRLTIASSEQEAALMLGSTSELVPAASCRSRRRSMLQTTRRHRNCPTSDRRAAQKKENPEPFIRAHDRPTVRVPWRRSGSGSSSTTPTVSVDPTEMYTIVAGQPRQVVKTRCLGLMTQHEPRRGIEPLRRANRRQPPCSVQFLRPFPAASCRSRRR